MITVEPGAPQSPPVGKSKCKKIGIFFFVLILLIGGLGFAVWFFGSPKPHLAVQHQLYSTFDSSPPHKKLLAGIEKAKVSLLVGKKEDALFKFVEHYANILSKKGRTVYVQQYSSLNPQVFQIAKDVNTKILSTIGQLKTDSDWIVISRNGQLIPEELITQIQVNYPTSKILVVSTTKQQQIKGSKSFSFIKIDQKELGKVITKAFAVKPAVVDILSDYHKTHEELFNGLNEEKFDPKTYLGQQYTSFEGLSKENQKVLADLCKNGKLLSKKVLKESPGLAQYGVIFSKKRNTPLWVNEEKILNYELFKGVNCKNEVANEAEIKEYEDLKIKQAEELKRKEEEQKAKEEAEKAKAQQKKAQEEAQKAKLQQKKAAQAKKEEVKKGAAKKEEKAAPKGAKPKGKGKAK